MANNRIIDITEAKKKTVQNKSRKPKNEGFGTLSREALAEAQEAINEEANYKLLVANQLAKTTSSIISKLKSTGAEVEDVHFLRWYDRSINEYRTSENFTTYPGVPFFICKVDNEDVYGMFFVKNGKIVDNAERVNVSFIRNIESEDYLPEVFISPEEGWHFISDGDALDYLESFANDLKKVREAVNMIFGE